MFKLEKCVETALNASQNSIDDEILDCIHRCACAKVRTYVNSNIKTLNFRTINVYLLINKEMANKYA